MITIEEQTHSFVLSVAVKYVHNYNNMDSSDVEFIREYMDVTDNMEFLVDLYNVIRECPTAEALRDDLNTKLERLETEKEFPAYYDSLGNEHQEF